MSNFFLTDLLKENIALALILKQPYIIDCKLEY